MKTSVALAIAVQAAFAARLLEDAVDYSVGYSDLTPYLDDGSGLQVNSSESVAVESAAPADDAAGDLVDLLDVLQTEDVEDAAEDEAPAAAESQDLTVEASDNQAVQSQAPNNDFSIDKIGEIATQGALNAQGHGDYYNVGLGGAHGGSLGG